MGKIFGISRPRSDGGRGIEARTKNNRSIVSRVREKIRRAGGEAVPLCGCEINIIRQYTPCRRGGGEERFRLSFGERLDGKRWFL